MPDDPRLNEHFEASFFRLYDRLHQEQYLPALHLLRASLTALLKTEFTESRLRRVRVEEGRIKGRNRALVKARLGKYAGRILSPEDAFAVITDFVGTRVTCNTVSDAYAVLAVFKKAISIETADGSLRRVCDDWAKDFIKDPKDTGYRAISVLVAVPVPTGIKQLPITCEVQIRTLLQHAWGELTHEDTYKPGVTPPDLVVKLSKRLATTLAVMDEIAQDIRTELDRAEHRDVGEAPPPGKASAATGPLESENQDAEEPQGEPPHEDEPREGADENTLATIDEVLSAYAAARPDSQAIRDDLKAQLVADHKDLLPVRGDDLLNALQWADEYDEALQNFDVRLTDYGKVSNALDYIGDPDTAGAKRGEDLERAARFKKVFVEGAELFGTVVYVGNTYALVQLDGGDKGILHATSLKGSSRGFIEMTTYVREGDTVKVRVKKSRFLGRRRIELSLVQGA